MGRNRLVYGENTEITYLVNILKVMLGICTGIGFLLILLGQMVYGCIGLASALVIAVIILCERRKQYQKIDGSFLYNEREVSIHVDIYGKMRKIKPVIINYGDKPITMQSCEGTKYAKSLTFMLDEKTLCVFRIDRKKQGITVLINEEIVAENNCVRKQYLLPDEK